MHKPCMTISAAYNRATQLARLFGSRAGTLLVEEMEICAGKARIDMAIVCDRLIGIEIKGPKDDLYRLPGQVDQYSKCFDIVVLVVHEKLAADALDLIPSWWGVVTGSELSGSYTYTLKRRPTRNKHAELDALLALLWKDEIGCLWTTLLDGVPPPRASKKELRSQLLSRAPARRLKTAGIDLLRSRRNWRSSPIR